MDRIIVPTGYMGSGSSAVTDLISEFKDCQNEHKDYEFIFLHCPNGVFDLEDRLLIGNNAIKSDDSIRNFEIQMNKLYDKKYWWIGNYKKIIGKEFKEYTSEYINNIQQFNYQGYWYMHEEVNFKMFLKLLIRKPIKIISRGKIKFKKILKYHDGMKISFLTDKEFYKYFHDYIYKIIEKLSKGNKNIILDQLVLPFNLFRIDNYFDDKLKVIVVERDPRDVFITNKYIWGEKNLRIPMPLDVEEYCQFYKKMRESEKKHESNKILRVKFEDLIYNYDSELNRIMKFLNFTNNHINKKMRFNPEISIKNTQLFRKKEYLNEIKIIEEKLSKYLYDFPTEIVNDIKNSVEFN